MNAVDFFTFFTEDSKRQIEKLSSEFQALGEKCGNDVENKIGKLLKGYIKLGYNVLSPDIAQKTTRDDVKNKVDELGVVLDGINPEDVLKSEPCFAEMVSVLYNRLQTCKKLFKINLQEMNKLRTDIIQCNWDTEKKLEQLIDKFVERIKRGEAWIKHIQKLIDRLDELFKMGSDLFLLP